MLGFLGISKNNKIKKASTLRTIASLSAYDLDFVKDTYKGGTMNFTGGGLATDIFKYGGNWYVGGHTEQVDGSVVFKAGGNLRRTNMGIWVEQARTNAVLYSRDLTNAAWIKTNMTAAKNQVGMDNVANAASSITATAANATILQPIVLASSQRFQSAYVKRLIGSGAISMTMDGGVTYTDITSQVTTTAKRVSIPTALLTDPQVGFKVAVSGDSFMIDFVQNENGLDISSPRETTSAAVNSYGDRSTAEDSGGSYLSTLPPLLRGYHGWYMELSATRDGNIVGPLVSSAGTQARINANNSVSYAISDGGTIVTTPAGAFVRGRYNINKIAAYIKSDGTLAICCNGGAVYKVAGVAPNAALIHMDLGTNGSQGQCIHGSVKRVSFFGPNILTDADLIAFTAP